MMLPDREIIEYIGLAFMVVLLANKTPVALPIEGENRVKDPYLLENRLENAGRKYGYGVLCVFTAAIIASAFTGSIFVKILLYVTVSAVCMKIYGKRNIAYKEIVADYVNNN